MNKTGIIGCGWLGLRMAHYLQNSSVIHTTVTTEAKCNTLLEEGINATVLRLADDRLQAYSTTWQETIQPGIVLITVPFSKATPVEQLMNRFRNLCSFLGAYSGQLFLMSSIGIYPQLAQEITENSLPEEQLTGNILAVEKLVQSFYPQVNILRLGGLMGDNRVFSKYKVSDLDQPVNHVHYQDICRAVDTMVQQRTQAQTYNIVAPLHPSKEAVIQYQQQIPHTAAPPAAGRIISSHKLIQELNFRFHFPDPRLFPV